MMTLSRGGRTDVEGRWSVIGRDSAPSALDGRRSRTSDRAWTVAEGRKGRLVVIGLKGLDRDRVTRALLG